MAYLPPIFPSTSSSFHNIFQVSQPQLSHGVQPSADTTSAIPPLTQTNQTPRAPPRSNTSLASIPGVVATINEPQTISRMELSGMRRKKIVGGGTVAPTLRATPLVVPRFGAIPSQAPHYTSFSPDSISSSGSPSEYFESRSAISSPATTVSPAEAQTPISDPVAQGVVSAFSPSPSGDAIFRHKPSKTLGKRRIRDDDYGDEQLSEVFHGGNSDKPRTSSCSGSTPSGTSPYPDVIDDVHSHSALDTTSAHSGKSPSSAQSSKQVSHNGKAPRKKKRRQGNCSYCQQPCPRLDQNYLKTTHYPKCPQYPHQAELRREKKERSKKKSTSVEPTANSLQSSAHTFPPSTTPTPIPMVSFKGLQASDSASQTQAACVINASLVIAPPIVDPNEQAVLSAMANASLSRDPRYLIPFMHLRSVQQFQQGMLAEDHWRMMSLQLFQQQSIILDDR